MKDLAEQILERLDDLGAWVFYRAATGSVYIKFENPKLCSLRIADHEGRPKYRYKWNLIENYLMSYEKHDRGTHRRYYCLDDIDKLVGDLHEENAKLTALG